MDKVQNPNLLKSEEIDNIGWTKKELKKNKKIQNIIYLRLEVNKKFNGRMKFGNNSSADLTEVAGKKLTV